MAPPGFPPPDPLLGVMETLLVFDGAPVELEAHLARMQASVAGLYVAVLPADTPPRAVAGARGLALGRLRLTAAPTAGGAVSIDVTSAAVDPVDVFPAWERAATLMPVIWDSWRGEHKWADRASLTGLDATHRQGRGGRALSLLIDGDGAVLEASRANVFAVQGAALVTPPVDGRILAGVTRARVIEIATALGIEVREQPLTLNGLLAAGEAFLTGAVRGVEPVRAVGEAALAPPGSLAQEIAAQLERAWITSGAVRGGAA